LVEKRIKTGLAQNGGFLARMANSDERGRIMPKEKKELN